MGRFRRRAVRWLLLTAAVVGGFLVPFLVVAQVVVWAAPKPAGSDMALGLYAFFLAFLAGLAGFVIAVVLAWRWHLAHPPVR